MTGSLGLQPGILSASPGCNQTVLGWGGHRDHFLTKMSQILPLAASAAGSKLQFLRNNGRRPKSLLEATGCLGQPSAGPVPARGF